MSKHHWKSIGSLGAVDLKTTFKVQLDVCELCGIHRRTDHSDKYHFTNYSTNCGVDWLRTAPVCIDKVNPEIKFPEYDKLPQS